MIKGYNIPRQGRGTKKEQLEKLPLLNSKEVFTVAKILKGNLPPDNKNGGTHEWVLTS